MLKTVKKTFLTLFIATGISLFASFVFLSMSVHAAPGDFVTIPDSNLKACLLTQVTHANPNDITEAEAAADTSVTCSSAMYTITSLTGIEYFSGLATLSLTVNTSVTDLSPLSGLTDLTYLYVGGGNIADLSPLSGLTDLTSLHVNGIPVIAFPCEYDLTPLNTLTNLTDLFVGIGTSCTTDLSDLAGLTALGNLQLNGGRTDDLTPLESLTNLESLSIWVAESVTDFSALYDLTGLLHLSLSFSSVSSFTPFTPMTQLETLSLHGANFSGALDVSPLAALANLTSLQLMQNDITDISELSDLTGLTYLSLGYNDIVDVSALANLTNLTGLVLYNNHIRDISPLVGLTNLSYVYLTSQAVTLPSLATDTVQSNPLRGLTGLPIIPTGTSLNYNNATDTWTYQTAGAHTLTWSQPVTIGSASSTFGGTITQTSASGVGGSGGGTGGNEGNPEIPGVPNTGVVQFITKNPLIVLVGGILSAGLILIAVRTKRRV